MAATSANAASCRSLFHRLSARRADSEIAWRVVSATTAPFRSRPFPCAAEKKISGEALPPVVSCRSRHVGSNAAEPTSGVSIPSAQPSPTNTPFHRNKWILREPSRARGRSEYHVDYHMYRYRAQRDRLRQTPRSFRSCRLIGLNTQRRPLRIPPLLLTWVRASG